MVVKRAKTVDKTKEEIEKLFEKMNMVVAVVVAGYGGGGFRDINNEWLANKTVLVLEVIKEEPTGVGMRPMVMNFMKERFFATTETELKQNCAKNDNGIHEIARLLENDVIAVSPFSSLTNSREMELAEQYDARKKYWQILNKANRLRMNKNGFEKKKKKQVDGVPRRTNFR